MVAISNGWFRFSNTISQSRINRVILAAQRSFLTGKAGDALKMGPVDRAVDYVFCGRVKERFINCLYEMMQYQAIVAERRLVHLYVDPAADQNIQAKKKILEGLMRGASLKINAVGMATIGAVIEPVTQTNNSLINKGGCSSQQQGVPQCVSMDFNPMTAIAPMTQAPTPTESELTQARTVWQDLSTAAGTPMNFALPLNYPEALRGKVSTEEELAAITAWNALTYSVVNNLQNLAKEYDHKLAAKKTAHGQFFRARYNLAVRPGELIYDTVCQLRSAIEDAEQEKEEILRKISALMKIYSKLFVLARDCGSLELCSLFTSRISSLNNHWRVDGDYEYGHYSTGPKTVPNDEMLQAEDDFLLNFSQEYITACDFLFNSTPSVEGGNIESLTRIDKLRLLLRKVLKTPGNSWIDVSSMINNFSFAQTESQNIAKKVRELKAKLDVFISGLTLTYRKDGESGLSINATPQMFARICEVLKMKSRLTSDAKSISMGHLAIIERLMNEHCAFIHQEKNKMGTHSYTILSTEVLKRVSAKTTRIFSAQEIAELQRERFRQTGKIGGRNIAAG